MSSLSAKKGAPSKLHTIWHLKDQWGSSGLVASLSAPGFSWLLKWHEQIKVATTTTPIVEDFGGACPVPQVKASTDKPI